MDAPDSVVEKCGYNEALAVATCSIDAARAADDVSGGGLRVPSSAVDAAAAVLVPGDHSATGAAGVPPTGPGPTSMMLSDALREFLGASSGPLCSRTCPSFAPRSCRRRFPARGSIKADSDVRISGPFLAICALLHVSKRAAGVTWFLRSRARRACGWPSGVPAVF